MYFKMLLFNIQKLNFIPLLVVISLPCSKQFQLDTVKKSNNTF